MAKRIYIRDEEDALKPLEEESFSIEDELQALIAEHPELLDGEQIRPGNPRRWTLITREQGIAATPDTGAWWAVDLLIVDQDATPTLVEVKRGSNPEIRRTIVGQMLEYAAHAAKTWTVDELRNSFEESVNAQGLNPDKVLGELLEADGAPDADGFWKAVSTNLGKGRLRLMFVADEIPDPLEQVVEFLNIHMPDIEVLAVEIKQFQSESTQVLVPRVLGRSMTSSAIRPGPHRNLTSDPFLDDFCKAKERQAAERLLKVAQDSGAKLAWGLKGVTIRWPYQGDLITVAWLYTPSNKGTIWSKTKDFSFGFYIPDNVLQNREKLRTLLQEWVNNFHDDPFAKEASGKLYTAYSIGHDDVAQNIDLLEGRLAKVLQKLKSLQGSN